MSKPNCKFYKIVASSYCTIWHCPKCGTIDLQLGDLALRLSPAQVQGIASGLNQALQVMDSSPKISDLQAEKTLLPH